ncbi:MAG: hypothetical protein Q8O59_02490, partial [bacterium]|nr:hypothetical protein [bacterium]
MSTINFLDNKKHEDQKPKDDKKEKLAWSSPKKEVKDPKGSAFSFLPFLNKKEPVDKNSASLADKNKIKQSREEILNLIKHHEDSKPLPQEKSKNFLTTLGEKLKKQPGRKEVLIDYQRVFNQEKEHKNQIGKLFNIKSLVEAKPELSLTGKTKDGWFKGMIKSFKSSVAALSTHKNETAKIVKLPKVEEIKPIVVKPPISPQPIIQVVKKPVEIQEIKIEESEPIHKNEVRQRVIETNLIQGELVT